MNDERAPTRSEVRIEVDDAQTSGPLASRFLGGEAIPCWLGLSPTTPFVNTSKLTPLLTWTRHRSNDVLVVEGTFLARWNRPDAGVDSAADALQLVRRRAKRFGRRVARIAHAWSEGCRVFDWEAAVSDKRFASIRDAIADFAEADREFGGALRRTRSEYLNKTELETAASLRSRGQIDGLRYIVEELSVFAMLYLAGRRIEIYPGDDLPILRDLALGRFPGFPFPCPDRTHISLKVIARTPGSPDTSTDGRCSETTRSNIPPGAAGAHSSW